MSNFDENKNFEMVETKEQSIIGKIIDKIKNFFKIKKVDFIDKSSEEHTSNNRIWSPIPTEIIEKEYLPTADYDEIDEKDYFSEENMITNKETYDIVMGKLSSGELTVDDLSIPDILRINSMLETELDLKIEKYGITDVDLYTDDNEN